MIISCDKERWGCKAIKFVKVMSFLFSHKIFSLPHLVIRYKKKPQKIWKCHIHLEGFNTIFCQSQNFYIFLCQFFFLFYFFPRKEYIKKFFLFISSFISLNIQNDMQTWKFHTLTQKIYCFFLKAFRCWIFNELLFFIETSDWEK